MITAAGGRYLVEGPVTLANVNALLAEGLGFEGEQVLVDFSKTTEVDSSAVSLMLEWRRRLRGDNRDIVYANLGANLTSLVDLYGVAELVPLAA